MAGLLAWAADVVGGSGQSEDGEDEDRVLPLFTPEQHRRARELDDRAASLRRAIQDLRVRIPPAHIAQRLPHLHAHSVASNNALALQLNAHSTTREQAQQREVTLLEENAAYEKAISNCQMKIDDKIHEADLLCSKLKEMDLIEKSLKDELDKVLAAADHPQSGVPTNTFISGSESNFESRSSKNDKLEELEEKKRELIVLEGKAQRLENQWSALQHEMLKQPSAAQREKLLEKQLHSLVEQLTAKQAQAEDLVREIRMKEKEVERLNGLREGFEGETIETNTTKNRFARSSPGTFTDYAYETHRRPSQTGNRTENQQKLMLMRSAIVLYILALHVIVFIKISF